MLFSSIVFLCVFFPTVLLLYYLFSFSRVCQNVLLLLASLLFYAWGEPVYVLLMLASIVGNSLLAALIEKRGGGGKGQEGAVSLCRNGESGSAVCV